MNRTTPSNFSAASDREYSIKLVSHSPKIFWWPVWKFGVLMAFLTYWEGRQVVLGIREAAEPLYPCFGLLISPIIAGATLTLSTFSVINNGLRLRKMKLQLRSMT